jgi:hypothetical protein
LKAVRSIRITTLLLIVAGNLREVFERRQFRRAAKPRLQKFRHFGERGVADHHRMEPLAAAMQHEVEEGHEVAFENLFP